MNLDYTNWWKQIEPAAGAALAGILIPIGLPGFAGANKHAWQAQLDARYGVDGWRIDYYMRGKFVSFNEAIAEYERSYRVYLHSNPELVEWLATWCGNVYDDNRTNVHDDDYFQPHTRMNHYQDVAVRRVIAELVDDPAWPDVIDTPAEEGELIDLNDGSVHRLPRARGMRGRYLMQIRTPESPGFLLSPAVVPVHDPSLITAHPQMAGWYHTEGCQHLSVEAFWQMSKVLVVRYDRFLALGKGRQDPLAGLERETI
ncbi:MAG: hypothetical protein R6W76_12120 [Caldilinea sp.]